MISPQYVDGLELRIKELVKAKHKAEDERDELVDELRYQEERTGRAEAERDALAAHVEVGKRIMSQAIDAPEYRQGPRPQHVQDYLDWYRATPTANPARHPDDAAVDRFAVAMKAKLTGARAKGRDGWNDPDRCSAEFLADLLVGHVGKGNAGNLEDIANLAMMLHQRGDDPVVLTTSLARLKVEALADFAKWAQNDLSQDGLFINFDELIKRYHQQAEGKA